MEKLFNTYKNKHGQNIPKSAIIENSPEIREYLKTTYSFPYKNGVIHDDDPWIVVGISASWIGHLYFNIFTDKNVAIFDYSCVKDFTDFEAFKKYLNWAHKLPRYIVNKK